MPPDKELPGNFAFRGGRPPLESGGPGGGLGCVLGPAFPPTAATAPHCSLQGSTTSLLPPPPPFPHSQGSTTARRWGRPSRMLAPRCGWSAARWGEGGSSFMMKLSHMSYGRISSRSDRNISSYRLTEARRSAVPPMALTNECRLRPSAFDCFDCFDWTRRLTADGCCCTAVRCGAATATA